MEPPPPRISVGANLSPETRQEEAWPLGQPPLHGQYASTVTGSPVSYSQPRPSMSSAQGRVSLQPLEIPSEPLGSWLPVSTSYTDPIPQTLQSQAEVSSTGYSDTQPTTHIFCPRCGFTQEWPMTESFNPAFHTLSELMHWHGDEAMG